MDAVDRVWWRKERLMHEQFMQKDHEDFSIKWFEKEKLTKPTKKRKANS